MLLMLASLATGCIQPYSGAVIDRLGARSVTLLGLAAQSSGMLCLAAASGPAAVQLALGLIRVGGVACVFLACDTVLQKWFVALRGRVMALQRCSLALAMNATVPLLLGYFLEAYGFQAAVTLNSIGVAGAPSALLLRPLTATSRCRTSASRPLFDLCPSFFRSPSDLMPDSCRSHADLMPISC